MDDRLLTESRLRASPAFELVAFADLADATRERLAALERSEDLYGVLVPRKPGARLKSACHNTARLLLDLAEPRRLPAALLDDASARRFIAAMVLDGVLEVERPEGFVTGVDLARLEEVDEDAARLVPAARLSLAALRHGARLELTDVRALSARLYAYNRWPAAARWTRRLGHGDAELEVAGLDAVLRARLQRRWAPASAGSRDPWARYRTLRPALARRGAPFKLYISPTPDALATVLRPVLGVLEACDARSFKLGRGVGGILRADKLVAYFVDRDALGEALTRLGERLVGVAAQGVPFTARGDDHGLLSWGIDPPPEVHPLPWQGPSWRRFIADQLAAALVDARLHGRRGPAAVAFARERMRAGGIDPDSWVPLGLDWELESP